MRRTCALRCVKRTDMARRRLDSELVRRDLAESRTAAKHLVEDGRVLVKGIPAQKPASQVDAGDSIVVLPPKEGVEYVSRGAHKLLGALDAFEDLLGPQAIEGARCLDAGASTGGFTQVLLENGAASVLAVDVGYGQLAWQLREDPRVEVLERTNIRHLTRDQVGEEPAIVVGDMSFISLTKVLDNLVDVAPNATMMLMVKPQFEVGKGKVPSGGVVRNQEDIRGAVLAVARYAESLGLKVWGVAPSPLPGPAGNVEYFLLLAPPSFSENPVEGDALVDAVERAVEVGSALL